MRKPWVNTDPNVIAIKEYARKTVKVVTIVTVVYVMAYAAGKSTGLQIAAQNQQ